MAQAQNTQNDYGSHQRTYYHFLHLLKWFTVHVVVIMAGIYFLIVEPVPILGFLLVTAGVVLLGYGISRTGVVAQERLEKRQNRAEQGAA